MQTPWAVILCKFKGTADEPFPVQYYKDLFTVNDIGSPWNMIRYFRDYSHGRLDLTGTEVFGWYQLDQTVDYYNKQGQGARDALISWARTAAVANGVDLKPFFSTVVCMNDWQDIGASASLSGVVVQGPLTPFPRGLGHEMGHVYGLMHSRVDGSELDYQDPWDTMSAFNDYSTPDKEFTLIGPGFNAWNMRSRGWLDESRVWKDGGDQTIKLRPHVRRDLPGFLAAELLGGFLVEFRVREGWDGAIPRPAVLVHRFQDGHSYLMYSNSGSLDLVAGDSFGDVDPGPSPINPFSTFRRVDVLSIDARAEEATLRIRCYKPIGQPLIEWAIDPMYLILPGSAYLRWVEQHYPHVPKVADFLGVVRGMPPDEQKATLSRAKTLAEYGKAIEEAFEKVRE